MEDNFLKRTRQSWKLKSIYTSIILCWLAIALLDYLSTRMSGARINFLLGIVLAAEFVFVTLLCSSIKCPSCGSRLVWWAIKNNKLHRLVLLKECPICNYGFDVDRSGGNTPREYRVRKNLCSQHNS